MAAKYVIPKVRYEIALEYISVLNVPRHLLPKNSQRIILGINLMLIPAP